MLQSQGCPVSTSSCGDICYVLTPAAASDLHSVAIGTSNTPHHHWHDPTSFWTTGVCNGKSQCVSVNPFDDDHNFDDLANTLLDVEKECKRSVGMATMFILAKAMEPPAWVKQKRILQQDLRLISLFPIRIIEAVLPWMVAGGHRTNVGIHQNISGIVSQQDHGKTSTSMDECTR